MSNVRELLRIERSITMRAPRSRVWRALTRTAEFSQWFSVEIEGAEQAGESFRPGQRLVMITTHEEYKGIRFPLVIDRVEPEALLTWRWFPGSALPESQDPERMTEVVFRLREVGGDTELTVIETGFENVDLAVRAKAFEENVEGWEAMLTSLERHVVSAP